MRIGIDASNLRSGGALTHVSELLAATRPGAHGVTGVVVWGGSEVLSRLPARPWIQAVHDPILDGPLPGRVRWQQKALAGLARNAACDLLFVPGGTYLGDFRPFVTMSQNMLPFDTREMRRFGASAKLLKFVLLRLGQSKTFRQADGTIFLHDHARSRIVRTSRALRGPHVIVPHGVAPSFRAAPRTQRPLSDYSTKRPFKLLYVSAVDAYKHQWRVAEAVARLVRRGLPVTLDLVGPIQSVSWLKRLHANVRQNSAEAYVHYRGPMPYHAVPAACAESDAFVFASTCENLPISLLEAMNAGLPIACSDRAPMPDVLGGGGIYFNSDDVVDITDALHRLVTSPEARNACASIAYERAQQYTWERCADDTFSFLRTIA